MAETPFTLSKANSIFLKIAAVSTGVVAVVGLYGFYRNNIWSPEIVVNEVDYKKGIAKLTINGKPFLLKGDSSYLIEYDWGIKFGTSLDSRGNRFFDRIEILKRGLVHKVLRDKDDAHLFTGSEEGIVSGVWGVPKSAGFDVFQDKSFTGDEKNFWNNAFDDTKSNLVVKGFADEG